MKYLFVLILISAFPSFAYAELLATIGWDSPINRENGDALSADEIDEYRVYRVDGITPILVWSGKSGPHELTIPDGESHSYAVSTVDTNGIESKLSKYISVSASAPKPPVIYFIRK